MSVRSRETFEILSYSSMVSIVLSISSLIRVGVRLNEYTELSIRFIRFIAISHPGTRLRDRSTKRFCGFSRIERSRHCLSSSLSILCISSIKTMSAFLMRPPLSLRFRARGVCIFYFSKARLQPWFFRNRTAQKSTLCGRCLKTYGIFPLSFRLLQHTSIKHRLSFCILLYFNTQIKFCHHTKV